MKWKILSSDYLLKTPWLTVRKDHIRQSSGVELDDFYIIESQDWVNVIAITEEGNYIIEEQYRHGIQQVCIELCAGNVERDETPLQAAQRELLEETGYTGGEWSLIGIYSPNTSSMTNFCHCFLAKGVYKVQVQHLDKSEEIHTRIISEEELRQLLVDDCFFEGVMAAPIWKYLSTKLTT